MDGELDVGDRVMVYVHRVPEEGIIERRCERLEWDWWVRFKRSDDPVPYRESELIRIDGT